ncbi:MAG TPA: hypothetical protein VMM18_08560 [Gemmatimonadaceae bacterium]|nr:hypothetical protein [Gemmatimonadaceae bacterium]
MSVLRTLRDRRDRRLLTLIHATSAPDRTIFLDEMASLGRDLALDIVPVYEQPPEDWTGERGFLTGDLLARRLPKDHHGMHYFICGPAPMMDVVEGALAVSGVPMERLHTERFDFA